MKVKGHIILISPAPDPFLAPDRILFEASISLSAGIPYSPLNEALCPRACTPASVRLVPLSFTSDPQTAESTRSSSPCTVLTEGCFCQPKKPLPSYSIVSKIFLSRIISLLHRGFFRLALNPPDQALGRIICLFSLDSLYRVNLRPMACTNSALRLCATSLATSFGLRSQPS